MFSKWPKMKISQILFFDPKTVIYKGIKTYDKTNYSNQKLIGAIKG